MRGQRDKVRQRGGTEAAPERLLFVGHPGGPPKVSPRRDRAPLKAGLRAVQNWMQAVITHPGGIGPGEKSAGAKRALDRGPGTIEQVILPSKTQSSRERLQIYANAYFWRLIDILGEEYPTVRHVIGDRAFHRLAMQFLEAHPSRSYSLNFLSVDFPAFLGREAKRVPQRGLVAAVAAVERAMEDVFDAPGGAVLTPKQWAKIPMADWMTHRVKMTPAMRLLDLDYPVDDFIAAVRRKRRAAAPARSPQHLVVYRRDDSVWRAKLSAVRFALLSALHAGRTLPQAFQECASMKGFDEKTFTASLKKWFAEWAADGLFCGLET